MVHATGVLAGRTRRALDSPLLDDAVATQDTVTQLVAAARRLRRLVPAAAALRLAGHDYDHQPSKPVCAWDDPAARQRLVSALVGDAPAVLGALEGAQLDGQQAEAVGLLGVIAGQDIEPGEQAGRHLADRPQGGPGPSDQRGRPRRSAHAQERQQLPRRLQGVLGRGARDGAGHRGGVDAGQRADGPIGLGLLAGEPAELEVLGNSAYGGGPTRSARRAAGHRQTIKPIGSRAAGRVGHQGRLHGRPGRTGRHLPGRAHRTHHGQGAGGLQTALCQLSATRQVHHRHRWPDRPDLYLWGSRAPSRPPPGRRSAVSLRTQGRHRPATRGKILTTSGDDQDQPAA